MLKNLVTISKVCACVRARARTHAQCSGWVLHRILVRPMEGVCCHGSGMRCVLLADILSDWFWAFMLLLWYEGHLKSRWKSNEHIFWNLFLLVCILIYKISVCLISEFDANFIPARIFFHIWKQISTVVWEIHGELGGCRIINSAFLQLSCSLLLQLQINMLKHCHDGKAFLQYLNDTVKMDSSLQWFSDCIAIFQVLNKQNTTRITFQKSVYISFPTDGTMFAFFGTCSPALVQCFGCFFLSSW